MTNSYHLAMTRRQLLVSTATFMVANLGRQAFGRDYLGGIPAWKPSDTARPRPTQPEHGLYFTIDNATALEAIADRLIPASDSGMSGKEVGRAVFVDRQLASSFGDSRRLYVRRLFATRKPSQGLQSPVVPKERSRASLAALDAYCTETFAGKSFSVLEATQQDQILSGLEKHAIKLKDANEQSFLRADLQNTMEGFFADPLYGAIGEPDRVPSGVFRGRHFGNPDQGKEGTGMVEAQV